MPDPDDPRFAPYDPLLYELTHRGNPGDVEFYLAACRGARGVLELGCGWGRVSLALVAAGLEVVGLERQPGMLARLAERAAALPGSAAERLQLVQGDMAGFELGRRFERVIIPYNGLYCLLTEAEVASCLRSAAAHLAPGGRLVFDVYRVFLPDPDWAGDPDEDEGAEPLMLLTDGQSQIEVFERADWDQPGQRLDAWYRYRIHDSGGVREQEHCIPQRYLYPKQIDALLAQAGLAVVERFGDFDRGPFDADSDSLLIVAEPLA